jgi:hypothetical protein
MSILSSRCLLLSLDCQRFVSLVGCKVANNLKFRVKQFAPRDRAVSLSNARRHSTNEHHNLLDPQSNSQDESPDRWNLLVVYR